MQEKLIRNSFWSYAAKLSATVLFFAADVLIARTLDIGQYAEWAFFYSILSMAYYICWFGVNSSTKVFVSKAVQAPERRTCIRAGIRVRTMITAGAVLLTCCAALILPRFSFFRELSLKYPHLRTLLLFAAGIIGLNSYAEFFKETEIGTQNYRGVFILTTAEYGLLLAGGALGARTGRSPEGAGAGYLLAYALVFLLGTILVKKWEGVGSFRSGAAECGQYAKKILRYAVPLALIGIGGIILVEMDTMMLGMLSTPENVSDYAIAKQICTKASHINNALATGTLTSFSVITAADCVRQRDAFRRLSRINLLLTLAAGAAMFVLARFGIHILYGEKYSEAVPIVRFLVPYYILYGLSAFYALFLDFQGKEGRRSVWYMIMIGINFFLNLLLIPRYETAGACIATVVSLVPYTAYLLYATYRIVWKELMKTCEEA